MKNIVVILPMRSGSQRVINKNSRIIKGKHLYEYIIDKLLSFSIISKIVINTDIESVNKKYNSNSKIKLIKRSENLRGNCDINLVISESIKIIESDLLFKFMQQIHYLICLLLKRQLIFILTMLINLIVLLIVLPLHPITNFQNT